MATVDAEHVEAGLQILERVLVAPGARDRDPGSGGGDGGPAVAGNASGGRHFPLAAPVEADAEDAGGIWRRAVEHQRGRVGGRAGRAVQRVYGVGGRVGDSADARAVGVHHEKCAVAVRVVEETAKDDLSLQLGACGSAGRTAGGCFACSCMTA